MFVQEAGATVSPELLVGMRYLGTHGNKDGMGVMWVDHGRVQIEKKLAKTDDEVVELYNKHKHHACAVHQRNQTLGKIDEDNCHPFKVTSIDDGDPWDIWMMHNGTIREIQVDATKADSYNFATYFLRDFLRENPQASRSAHFCRILGGLIGKSKLILLSASGDPNDLGCYMVVNSGEGTILKPGIWVSRKEKIIPKPPSSPPLSKAPIGFKPPEVVQSAPLPPVEVAQISEFLAASTKMVPSQNGNWVMQPNGLKLFQVNEPPMTEASIDIPSCDLIAEGEATGDQFAMDLAVLGEMTEKEIEAVVEESPSLIARMLHIMSRAF